MVAVGVILQDGLEGLYRDVAPGSTQKSARASCPGNGAHGRRDSRITSPQSRALKVVGMDKPSLIPVHKVGVFRGQLEVKDFARFVGEHHVG